MFGVGRARPSLDHFPIAMLVQKSMLVSQRDSSVLGCSLQGHHCKGSAATSMAKVRAAYNYSYNYEGKKISFKKDEEFQLLTKSNKDWWQVRRWQDGNAQDIYVPAVYVKEVEDTLTAVKEADEATYMNLDDLKIPQSYENGTKGAGEKLPEGLTVQSKPRSESSVKKSSLERNKPPLEKESSSDNDNAESMPTSVRTNGLNPGRPVSPSMLRRLSNKGSTPEAQPGGSLKRGEQLGPPPVSTKPRSKTSASDVPETSPFDSGSRIQRQTSGGAAKSKVPPPVQSKPKPQKVPVARPVSCMAPGAELEGAGKPAEGVEGSRPIVSELSNVLLKKNPHFAGDHKPLLKTSSSGAMVESGKTGFRGDGLSKSLDARSPMENRVRRKCVFWWCALYRMGLVRMVVQGCMWARGA